MIQILYENRKVKYIYKDALLILTKCGFQFLHINKDDI